MTSPDSGFTVSVGIVAGIAASLAGYGVDVAALFHRLDLDYGKLTDADAVFDQDDVTRLWRASGDLVPDGNFGLATGARTSLMAHPLLAYALMSSDTFRDLCVRLVRFHSMVATGFVFQIEEQGDGVHLSFDILPGKIPYADFGMDGAFATFLTFVQHVSQHRITPLRAMLTRPRPVDTRYFDSIFNCPVRYGAARNGLVYSVDDMLFTLPTANRQMSVLHDSLIDKNLSEKQGGKYSKLAQNKIIARLSADSLTLETVSADLNMSVSGLKRRLQAEHTSFQQLVDETRRQLAESHLLHQDTSLAEIAFLLGFSESSAFNRAFKRWTGVTPRQWRQQVRHIE